MESRKRILIEHGNRKKLMSAFKTSYPTIRAALRYESDTEMARKIRFVAIKQYDGKCVTL